MAEQECCFEFETSLTCVRQKGKRKKKLHKFGLEIILMILLLILHFFLTFVCISPFKPWHVYGDQRTASGVASLLPVCTSQGQTQATKLCDRHLYSLSLVDNP